MGAIEIKITNLPQIRAAFNKSPIEMRIGLNTAIRKAVLTIQGKSMMNTPVLTGRLRASTSSQFGDLRGEIGTHTNYDVYVHDGTKFMAARPYLKDAVESASGDTERFFKDAVQIVLDNIARDT